MSEENHSSIIEDEAAAEEERVKLEASHDTKSFENSNSQHKRRRWEELYDLNKKQLMVKQMVEQYKKEAENQLDEECTFKPHINHKLRETSDQQPASEIYQKNLKWQQAKEKKLNEIHDSQLQKELESCTFKPEIYKKTKYKRAEPKGETIDKHTQNFIERQRKARMQQLEKKKAIELTKNLNPDTYNMRSGAKSERRFGKDASKVGFLKEKIEGRTLAECAESFHEAIQSIKIKLK